MKITIILYIIFSFITVCVYAEDLGTKSDIKIPPGMELRRSGRDVNVVVPEGSKFDKRGDVTLIENTDEYAAERFKTVNERLDKIEKEQAALKDEIDSLKKAAGKLP